MATAADLETGEDAAVLRQHHCRGRQSGSSASPDAHGPDDVEKIENASTSSGDGASVLSHEEESQGFDGHRPTLDEMRPSSLRSRSRHSRRSIAASTGASISRAASRRDAALFHIRSRPVPQFTHPLAHVPTTDAEIVDFDGKDDPYHPLNWPTAKKTVTTLLYGLATMTATWASSSYSAGTAEVALEFGIGTQVATLGTTLYLFGFGLGPLLWAPLSEVYGRRAAVMAPMLVATCFSFGSAAAKDLQTLMLTRFFGAFFASAPVTNTGGVLGDLYSPAWRGVAMAGYAMAVVAGPVLGMLPSLCLPPLAPVSFYPSFARSRP